jgi:hypothetical protein
MKDKEIKNPIDKPDIKQPYTTPKIVTIVPIETRTGSQVPSPY